MKKINKNAEISKKEISKLKKIKLLFKKKKKKKSV